MDSATVVLRPGVAIVVDLVTFDGGAQRLEAELRVADPSPPYVGPLPVVATVALDDHERIALAVEAVVAIVRLKMAAASGVTSPIVVEDRTQR